MLLDQDMSSLMRELLISAPPVETIGQMGAPISLREGLGLPLLGKRYRIITISN